MRNPDKYLISDVTRFPDEESLDKRFLTVGTTTFLGVINI